MKSNNSIQFLLLVLFTATASCEMEDRTPIPTYALSVLVSPSEGGTLTVSPSSIPTDINGDGIPDYGPFSEGQTITLTPQPNPNWVFQKWERGASGSSNPLTLIMNTDKDITAVFVKRD
jgi:hypothetical protein